MTPKKLYKQYWFIGSLVIALSVVLYSALYGEPHYTVGIFASYALIFYAFFRAEEKKLAYAEELKKNAEEKSFLLREMHHRIKNNMQVMMGLLETQSFKIKDPKYKQMFQSHVDRIKAMSYLHQNLYEQKSNNMIGMRDYLGKIVRNLQFMTSNTIHMEIDACELDMRQALNVGLIVNETVSNAIKYAYDDFDGIINVFLVHKNGKCMLHVQDFGKGYDPETFEDESLGVSMIQDMAEFLEDSTITINSTYGVSIVVMFSKGE